MTLKFWCSSKDAFYKKNSENLKSIQLFVFDLYPAEFIDITIGECQITQDQWESRACSALNIGYS